MDPWWLYLLVFTFGYVTCQTFYFFNATRVSLKLMKSSRVIYLLMMAKAMEKYKIAEEVMLMKLKESEKEEKVINNFQENFNKERLSFQNRSVSWVLDNTPDTFRDIVGFDNWESAMKYLIVHREEAYKFWRIEEDDR